MPHGPKITISIDSTVSVSKVRPVAQISAAGATAAPTFSMGRFKGDLRGQEPFYRAD